MRTIEVVEYNPQWPVLFAVERDALQHILQAVAIAIHHIGSTAVPGLAAKPTIDILVEVTNLNALDTSTRAPQDIGYEAKGEFGIIGRRYYEKGGNRHAFHVHAYAANDSNVMRHLAFRDYLRTHPHIADQYSKLKKRLAQDFKSDLKKYCAGKDHFVKHHEALALGKIAG